MHLFCNTKASRQPSKTEGINYKYGLDPSIPLLLLSVVNPAFIGCSFSLCLVWLPLPPHPPPPQKKKNSSSTLRITLATFKSAEKKTDSR